MKNKIAQILLILLPCFGCASLVAQVQNIEIPSTLITPSNADSTLAPISIFHRLASKGSKQTLELKHKKYINNENVLLQNFNLQLRSSGSGSLATLSMRGSSSVQTQVNYMNFNLNNPMLGTYDFAMLPIHFFNAIEVNQNSESAVGGTVCVDNTALIENKIEISSKINSVENVQLAVINESKYKKTTHKTSLMLQNNLNKFNYLIENNKVAAENVASNHKALFHTSSLDVFKKTKLLVGLWYQHLHRLVPPPITKKSSSDYQDDTQLKLFATSEFMLLNQDFNVGVMFARTNLDFYNSIANEVSKSEANEVQSFMNTSITISQKISAKSEFKVQSITATSKHYYIQPEIIRTHATFKLTHKNNVNTVLQSEIGVIHDQKLYWNGYLKYSTTKENILNKNINTEVGVYKTVRLPSINERYWELAGNRNINAEQGYNFQLAVNINRINSTIKNETSPMLLCVSPYFKIVENWISWLPNNGNWSPQNLKTVVSRGLDVTLNPKPMLRKYLKNILLQPRFMYSYNITNKINTPQQLIYTPQHRYTGSLLCRVEGYKLELIHCFTSEVFTTSDNSFAMPHYNIYNASISRNVITTIGEINLELIVNNLQNKMYQSIQNYYMPNRNIELLITFIF